MNLFRAYKRRRLWIFSGTLTNSDSCPHKTLNAQVAQLVEQRTENPRVGGSNPPLGTTISIGYVSGPCALKG